MHLWSVSPAPNVRLKPLAIGELAQLAILPSWAKAGEQNPVRRANFFAVAGPARSASTILVSTGDKAWETLPAVKYHSLRRPTSSKHSDTDLAYRISQLIDHGNIVHKTTSGSKPDCDTKNFTRQTFLIGIHFGKSWEIGSNTIHTTHPKTLKENGPPERQPWQIISHYCHAVIRYLGTWLRWTESSRYCLV